MAASGNSIALKSFQSFQVNDGLLVKVVEAVKAGEKEARTSGDVKSFEVFYKGFRQNIAIGRIYIVPAKVCNDRKNFPVALLFGTVVRELNLGEEVADLITNKIGDTEFDEYSQADFNTIKEKLFTGTDGKETSLILYAPHWANIRDYIAFKFTSDDEQLTNLLRHLVFAAYFNPAVSSAFDALMTTVDTFKFDVTDITPKLTYPFLSENPLKAFPNLNKAANSKKKIFLTAKTADAITQDVIDPQELNVFDALDDALTEAAFPTTTPIEEAGEYETSGVKETKVQIPEVGAEATLTAGLRRRRDYGEKTGADSKCSECGYPTEKGELCEDCMNKVASAKTAAFDRNATKCKDCGEPLDAFKVCPNTTSQDAAKGLQFCGKGQKNIPNVSLYGQRASAKTAKGRGFGKYVRGESISDFSGVHVGDLLLEHSNQFDADNTVIVSKDEFPENPQSRIWVHFVNPENWEEKWGEDFCIWGHELGKSVELWRAVSAPTPEPQGEPGPLFAQASKKKADTADNPANEKGGEGAIEVKTDKEIAVTAAGFDRNANECADCGKALDAFKMCPDVSPQDVRRGKQFCGKAKEGVGSVYLPPILKDGSTAPFETPFTNVGPGTSAHENADHALAVKVDSESQPEDPLGLPIGIPVDETGVPRRPEEERKVAMADKVAREIARDIDDGYVAMSSRAKAAVKKREDELNHRYAGRHKKAEVPLTEESIWDDIAVDFGEAPQVPLPGESETPSPTLPESMTTDKPEEVKGHAEEPAKAEEKALENPESKSEGESEPAESSERPKSKLFGKEDKEGEPKKEEENKEASSKTALLYMNAYDIEMAKEVLGNDPILGPAVRFLEAFKEEVDSHSDGWAYWKPPVASAAKLMTLIQTAMNGAREGKKHAVTVQDIAKSMTPIKSFMTSRGFAAGMQMPKLAVKKALWQHSQKANEIQPDIAEAKSEVVSPDTVDADIKQPTESAEQAAKNAAKAWKFHSFSVDPTGKTKKCTTCNKNKDDKHHYQPPDKSKKKGADVSGDVAEAKAEVVSPDTVDADIKQPTDSVEEAAAKTAYDSDKYTQDEDSNVVDRRDFSAGLTKWCAGCEEDMGDYYETGTLCDDCEADKKAAVREFEALGDSKENPELVQQQLTKAEAEQNGFLVELLEEQIKSLGVVPKVSAAKGHKHKCPSCGETLKCNNPKDCPGEGKEALCGSCPEYAKSKKKAYQELKQACEELDAMAGKAAADVSGDILEAKSEVDASKSELADDSVATDTVNPDHFAAAGDENDESVEMSLGFGDLADLAVNLPTQTEEPTIITASVSKTAEAYYTSKNFKTKKDLKEAVLNGKTITVYDPGQGMGGEAPPPVNGRAAVAGPHYPEPHRWYAEVTLKDGVIVGVK